MIGERNIIPGKSRKRNENFPYRQKESAGGKLKFYNINYKVSNLNGCLNIRINRPKRRLSSLTLLTITNLYESFYWR